MPPQVALAEVMQAYARDAAVLAQNSIGVNLDYSEASLENVDRLLEQRLANGLLQPDRMSEREQDELWTYCKTLGGYVGEVIVRNIGGSWEARTTESGGATIHLVIDGGVKGTPADAVWRALTEPYKGSMVTYYRSLLVALGRGERTTVNGILNVQLPELSQESPHAAPAAVKRPWWRFWQ